MLAEVYQDADEALKNCDSNFALFDAVREETGEKHGVLIVANDPQLAEALAQMVENLASTTH